MPTSGPPVPPAKTSRSSGSRRHESETNPDASLPGIGNYLFEKTIGQGNFAKVKLSKHKLTGQEVAVKIIDKTTLDEKKLSKLHREVRIMKMLNHPNIVKLFEVIETKHTLFLVMEYVNGGELYDYLVAHGRMKEKDARAKFRQILSAVNYCHRKRVIHRDLKAENLLLDENLNIKIADFGFSNHYAPDGQLDTFCGSPPYAAPELFQGRKYTGPEVDIWSLGVILYVLCTGCLPFDGKDLKEMREVVCRGRYKVPFYLSDTCEKLLRKFLVRDPTKRASLDMLGDDAWINEGHPDSPITTEILPDLGQEVDEEIIRYMTDKFNVPRDHILNCLQESTYDDVGAIYMLLHDQKSSGKWIPYQGSVLGPMSPISLQTGTANPISKATPMGTIGEEGDALAHFEANKESSSSGDAAVERRDRSHTVGNARQRPVTWVGNENQAQKIAAELAKGQDGSGPKLENAQLGTENGALRAPQPAHVRYSTVPSNFTGTATGGTNDMEDVKPEGQQPAKKGVIGAIRSLGRRLSESTANSSQAAAQAANQPVGDGEEKPRSLRFTFNSNTTSTKAPDELVKEIIAAAQKHNIKFQLVGRFLIECTWYFREAPIKGEGQGGGNMDTEQLQRALAEVMNGSVGNLNNKAGVEKDWKDVCRFDIEVCELPRLRNLHGLRFKRIGGPSTEYKEICGRLLAALNL